MKGERGVSIATGRQTRFDRNRTLADFVVLNRGLFEIDPYEISQLKPDVVVMDGEVVQGTLAR